MNIKQIIYKRNIIVNNIKSMLTEDIKGIQSTISNLSDRTLINNNNRIKTTILTMILLCPIIPGGIIALLKYKKNIKFAYNKYYNQISYNNEIKLRYGYEL